MQRKLKNAFTLLEMMMAIFVLMVGFLGVMSLVQRAMFSTSISSDRLIAAYLAQEGLEIVRNIRDSNWLSRIAWDQGLGTGNWEADYNDFSLSSWVGRYLKINAGGFYSYDSGSDTKFKRKITIQKPGQNILNVVVEVSWQEKGVPYSLSVQGNLYNWK